MENFSTHFGPARHSYRAAYLISGFIQRTLTEQEEKELDVWILASEANMQLFEDLTDEKMVEEFLQWYQEHDTEGQLDEVKKRIEFRKPSELRSILRYAAAACVIGLAGLGIYFYLTKSLSVNQQTPSIVKADLAPGSSIAKLKIASGHEVLLNHDTILANNIIVKNGEVSYANLSGNEPEMHEISIPRKGYYKLVLPDGSRVWLNSESSIRYPSRFSGTDRRVMVTGESYFEVAKDASKPFIVSVNGVDIQALGTAFNINAYPETGLQATLIEGSVRISDPSQFQILQPSEQLLVKTGQWKKLYAVDKDVITGWKEQVFRLRNATIGEVMSQVERWYDASIVYEGSIDFHFNGIVSRNEPVSKLLSLLEQTGQVHFEIEDNTIIVKK